mmetsp:Transcript_12265/g.23279  ORF Transcript_12265/g.23279 Transcript_12265/m.23279 type:complete len:366 (+) Transcript_12265:603-1700(+)|eukprot:CAMPEP_0204905270 /NCGR_PEP_ID=MMETSP1397-20131031/5332_1 /ASSEMBLY_ACC=CAM_ASM_000891 /TAXON_ID=49980 /ORGANISM="Climacostomum Climacostomum virens, Strain Stock W-24" /LENGTH=365 /DNA_ID=CAMNT_0052074141 /DNA_START=311 /DNA_END=1408 /DNA_ORIENTATION=-
MEAEPHSDVEVIRQAIRESSRVYLLSRYLPTEESKLHRLQWAEKSDLLVLVFSNPSVVKVISASTGALVKEIPLSYDTDKINVLHSIDNSDLLALFFLQPEDQSGNQSVVFRLLSLTSGTIVYESAHPDVFNTASDKFQRLYIPRGKHLDIFDLKTLSVVHTFTLPGDVYGVEVSPDASKVFFAVRDDNLYVVEAGTTTFEKVLQDRVGGWGELEKLYADLGIAIWALSLGDEAQELTAVSLTDGRVIKEGIRVQGYQSIRSFPKHGVFWIRNLRELSDKIQLIDPLTFENSEQITLPAALKYIWPLGSGDYAVGYDADGKQVALRVSDWSIFEGFSAFKQSTSSRSLNAIAKLTEDDLLEFVVL